MKVSAEFIQQDLPVCSSLKHSADYRRRISTDQPSQMFVGEVSGGRPFLAAPTASAPLLSQTSHGKWGPPRILQYNSRD